MKNAKKTNDLISQALDGNRESLNQLLIEVNDLIFNLSLRMLGTIADAEDATQEVLIKIITHLSSFQMNSTFETWVYRITTNYLIDYKKSMFAQHPLDFNYYACDINQNTSNIIDSIVDETERGLLANELKLSCTNVMLQCLTPLNRCIFILGTMFNLNSQLASEILNLTPQNYRKRLSRSRQKMQVFLLQYCELAGGSCSCDKRIEYAIQCSRLNPNNLEFSNIALFNQDELNDHKNIMEDIEDKADIFKNLPLFHPEMNEKEFLDQLLLSKEVTKLLNFSCKRQSAKEEMSS